ncbi:alpha-ketoacid dehydrogenase subunit beta [Leucobacter aridicollis]|uniref:Pyruvate dehydrogenase E1 component beta subunit n=1 Tax=Leucobacter aridicollis TaxID=283878 RepID=A0A852RCE2_9MICO|nr:transketolase C-terminal domain-containing protein [Leucobacter aridicollis]MBL3680918.1 alpha-ketoacid dehydrogenase subunit beta [Leucobacter aridicollis]NYD28079.1 pyruvate dehydrogenase E1 component beta subunit [Leucobacter aridicollis]
MTTLRQNINISQAIAESLKLEMAADDSVLVLGEDVGRQGGVFGSTRGLQRAFGSERVLDTPIAEAAFTGMAVGLALEGYRPVVEIMFADFIGVCLEQVYNAIAKNPYMSGGKVTMPIVVKTAGGAIGSAAQHSQSLWGLFAHLPGLRVVAPSNPHDSKGLMAAAVQSEDPVVFIEHKGLLLKKAAEFSFGTEVPKERYTVPLGTAAVVHPGSDITVVTLSGSVAHALEAAATLAAEGMSAEVIDLRSVVPIDWETIVASLRKTRRLLVVDEDYLGFGLSGELITGTVERLGLASLDAVARHGLDNVPIPAAISLERAVLPTVESIAAAIRRVGAL